MRVAWIETPSWRARAARSAPSSGGCRSWLLRAAALGLLLAGMAVPARSATYSYTGAFYTIVSNNTTCTVGTCASYTTAMRVTGSFTTAALLPASLPLTDITPLVTSYSFTDGVNTIASGDPDARAFQFRASTNGAGAIVFGTVRVQRWRTGSSPHIVGDRFDDIFIDIAASVAGNNRPCMAVGTSPPGTADTCTAFDFDTDVSIATADAAGTWSLQLSVLEVPTLSTWALGALAALLAFAAWMVLRRSVG